MMFQVLKSFGIKLKTGKNRKLYGRKFQHSLAMISCRLNATLVRSRHYVVNYDVNQSAPGNEALTILQNTSFAIAFVRN